MACFAHGSQLLHIVVEAGHTQLLHLCEFVHGCLLAGHIIKQLTALNCRFGSVMIHSLNIVRILNPHLEILSTGRRARPENIAVVLKVVDRVIMVLSLRLRSR